MAVFCKDSRSACRFRVKSLHGLVLCFGGVPAALSLVGYLVVCL